MPEPCPRCGATLPVIDAAPAPFCAVCGLPQLRISADALATPALPETPLGAPADQQRSFEDSRIRWRAAFPAAAVAAFAGILPALFFPGALALGGAGGICLLLVPLAALGAVAFYGRLPRGHAMGAKVGGRIGATTGLLLGTLAAVVTGLAGFLLRYGKHSLLLQQVLTQSVDQAIAQLRSTSTTPLPPETVAWLQAPEVRAGWFIAVQFFLAIFLILLGALFGAFGGSLLRSRHQRLSKG